MVPATAELDCHGRGDCDRRRAGLPAVARGIGGARAAADDQRQHRRKHDDTQARQTMKRNSHERTMERAMAETSLGG
jgi:hypothetical protein